MKHYYDLLAKKEKVKRDIRDEKIKQHKIFFKLNKKTFIFLDILVVLCILFNFGAVCLTNVMLVQERPEIIETLKEVNPVQAIANDLPTYETPEEKAYQTKLIGMLYKQFLLWICLIAFYVVYRRSVMTEEGLWPLIILVGFYFLALGWDFWNDFGWWIGKRWFG